MICAVISCAANVEYTHIHSEAKTPFVIIVLCSLGLLFPLITQIRASGFSRETVMNDIGYGPIPGELLETKDTASVISP